jgi:hypothetical protein
MRRTLAALIATAVLSSTAAAQDMGWSTIIPSVTGTDQLGIVLRESMQQQEARNGSSRAGGTRQRQGSTSASTAAADLAALRFTPSATRRAANQRAFVEKTRRIDQGNARDLERLFASGDLMDRLGEAMQPIGLRTDNLADAFAIWWITAWNATQGVNPTPSRAQAAAVRAQAARALASIPGIRGASDAQKQEFTEALLVQMVFVDVAVEQNRGNPAQLRALRSAVAQGARGMGLDLSQMRLTESGFVPAR